MPDPDQPVAAGSGAERGDGVGDGGIGQVDPADDAADERRRGGECEELGRLVLAGARLDEDRGVDARRRELRREVVGPERRGGSAASSSVSHG